MKFRFAMRHAMACLVLPGLALLSACGGGGGSAAESATPATPLPESVGISLPADAQSSQGAQFAPAVAAAAGWRFSWDFGDGRATRRPSPAMSTRSLATIA